MIYKSLQFDGLKIVLTPETKHRDDVGNPIRRPGKYIHFVKGTYKCGQRADMTEKEEVAALDKFMKEHPNQLVKVDEKKLAEERKYIEEAKKKAAAEWKKREEARAEGDKARAVEIERRRMEAAKATAERKAKEVDEAIEKQKAVEAEKAARPTRVAAAPSKTEQVKTAAAKVAKPESGAAPKAKDNKKK
jgi:colicin import membrane protein